jgi:hypothetical protein
MNARMAGPKLTLYVDTVSPFSYEAYYILRVSSGHASSLGLSRTSVRGYVQTHIGSELFETTLRELQLSELNRTLIRFRLQNDPVFQKCEITYVPIFLGGVMKACGSRFSTS